MSGKKQPSWVREVMENSDALDLKPGIFKQEDPRQIAHDLAESARKRDPERSSAKSDLQSAMSMLNFHINRSGSNLDEETRNKLEKTKDHIRKEFKKPGK